ncbi:MAG: hypothetical protein MUE97_05050, partial [Phycisphaerales bacterium]|nr:hypothetical protein [Phycisphaerales bacterium]
MKWLTRKNLVWAIVAVLTLAAVVVPLSIVTGVGRPDTLVGTAVVGALWCGCMLALLSLLETPGRLVHARMGMVAATVCAVMFVAGLWLQLRWWLIGQPLLLVSLSLTAAAIANGVVILAAGTPGVRVAGRRGDGLTTIACGVGWVLGGVLLLVSAAIVGNDRVQMMMAVIGAGVLISGAAIGANFAGVEAMRSGGWRVVGAGFTLLALVCLIAQTFWDTDVRLRRPDVQHPEIYGSMATIGITMGVWNLLAHSA